MNKIKSIIDKKRDYIYDLFKLRSQYRATLLFNDPVLTEKIKTNYHTYRKLQVLYKSYKSLHLLSDTQLIIYNSNERIKFIYDRSYCHALINNSIEKYLARTVTEDEYVKNLFIMEDNKQKSVNPKKRLRNNVKSRSTELRVRCFICGRETTYELFEDDGLPRLCIFCHKNISPPFASEYIYTHRPL